MEQSSDQASPARLFVLLIGAALVIGGIAGFFYEEGFGTGERLVADDVLGIFPTNGWDNLMHLIAGFACLLAAFRGPRQMALAIGGLFTALAIWGLLVSDGGVGSLLDVIPVDTGDNLLHLAIGLTGIVAGLAETRGPPPTAA